MAQPGGTHRISGDLTIQNPDVSARHSGLIQPGAANVFDFSECGRIDSVGIAMLIAWKRYASANSATVNFINLPPQALRFVSMYELDSLLLEQPAEPAEPAQTGFASSSPEPAPESA